jgi:hypothetical protein
MVIYNEIEFYPIPNYEGYYISTSGEVLSTRPKNGKGPCDIKKARIMKPYANKHGYKYIILGKKNYKRELKKIHRLVAETFLEDFNNPNLVVDHKDNDKLNNNLDNLHMVTPSQNSKNIKKRKGVSKVFCKRDNLWRWGAHWTDDEGRAKYKSFSVTRYGELFSYLLATEYRQAMVDKYYNRP